MKTHVPAKEVIALSALIATNPADFVRPRILRGVQKLWVLAGEVEHGKRGM